MNDNTSLKSATDAGFGINGPSVVVTPSRTPVVTAIESHDAIGFVNINTTESEYPTASFRYLTAISSSNNSAYVHTDSGPVLCVQSEATKKAMQAEYRALSKQIEYSDSLIACDEISAASEPGDNRVNSDIAIPIYQDSRPIGVQAAAVLDSARTTDAECADTQTVLVPSTIPHDSAIHLEQAGYTLQSTSAVTNARVKKDAAERQAIKIVQSAGLAAIARIETQIADMTVSDGQLLLQGEPATTRHLEQIAAAELAHRGVGSGDCVCVITTESAVSRLSRNIGSGVLSSTSIQSGVPVQIGVCPRGPNGYHGLVWRTIVVESEGGWERRAHIAVEAALETAIETVEPGISPTTVYNEALAELAAFGFNPSASEGSAKKSEDINIMIHGIGLSKRERPYIDSEMTMDPGTVVSIALGVFNIEYGGVRLCDVVTIGEDGVSVAGSRATSSNDMNRSLTPTANSYSS